MRFSARFLSGIHINSVFLRLIWVFSSWLISDDLMQKTNFNQKNDTFLHCLLKIFCTGKQTIPILWIFHNRFRINFWVPLFLGLVCCSVCCSGLNGQPVIALGLVYRYMNLQSILWERHIVWYRGWYDVASIRFTVIRFFILMQIYCPWRYGMWWDLLNMRLHLPANTLVSKFSRRIWRHVKFSWRRLGILHFCKVMQLDHCCLQVTLDHYAVMTELVRWNAIFGCP